MQLRQEKAGLIPESPTINAKSDIEESQRTAGLLPSILNLLNTCVGGGVLAYPYGFLSTGLLTGALVTFFLGILAGSTLLLICFAADMSKDHTIRSYQDVMKHYLGKVGKKISEVILALYLAGASIVMLIISGDCLEQLASFIFPADTFFQHRTILILIFAILFVFPLALLRRVKLLSYPSSLANLGVLYLGIVLIVSTLILLFKEKPFYTHDLLFFNTTSYKNIMPQVFLAVPIIAFSFQCHVIIMPIYHELKNPTLGRMAFIVVVSIVLTVIIYISIGVFGMLLFGNETKEDVLVSFPPNSVVAIIARVAISVTSLFSFPMVYFTCRLSLQTLFKDIKGCDFMFDEKEELKTPSFLVFTVVTFGIITIIAVSVPDIVTVFGFVGSIGAVTLDFYLPSFVLLVIVFNNKRLKIHYKILAILFSILLICVATVMMVGGVGVTIFKLILSNVKQ